MTVVVLQHVEVEGPGRIAAALDRAALTWRTIMPGEGLPVPVGPAGIEGLVVMGGPMGVGDSADHPYLEREKDLIADCVAADVPVLGICLGAQLLAATLGAHVRPGPGLELGWLPVTLTPESGDDPLFAGAPRLFDALHWHGDVFDLPSGSVHLASSEQTGVQAFRHGRSAYGLLFHLEADVEQVARMADAFPDEVTRSEADLDDLLDPRHPSRIAVLADQVFDAWVSLLR